MANETRPLLQFTSEDHHFQITLDNQVVNRGGEALVDSIVFECHSFPSVEESLEQAMEEMGNWSARWQTLQQAILYLAGGALT